MKTTLVLTAALCLMAVASARPKYIAIPVEDIQFLSFSPSEHHRVARQAVYGAPSGAYATQEADDIETAASNDRPVRQAGNHGDHHGDHHDYVDYGAHTGHHGAFGWYADYPVHTQGH